MQRQETADGIRRLDTHLSEELRGVLNGLLVVLAVEAGVNVRLGPAVLSLKTGRNVVGGDVGNVGSRHCERRTDVYDREDGS